MSDLSHCQMNENLLFGPLFRLCEVFKHANLSAHHRGSGFYISWLCAQSLHIHMFRSSPHEN